jgi:ankyrin repeat protein
MNSEQLYKVIINNNIAKVKELLEGGFDVNTEIDSYGKKTTMLSNAASSGHLEMVELLLSFNADVNLHNPLYSACCGTLGEVAKGKESYNRIKIVECLIEKGANNEHLEEDDEEDEDNEVNTTLMAATTRGFYYVVKLLLKYSSNDINYYIFPMKEALLDGYKEIAELIFDKLCENFNLPECTNENQLNHVLLYAAYRGSLKIVKKLVESGFDINFKNSANECARDFAAENNQVEVLEFINNNC